MIETVETYSSYKTFCDSDDCQKIESFLREPENKIRMITASELRRPALEGIQFQLKARFGVLLSGDGDRQKNVRKWTGKLVRKCMVEEWGYQIQGVSPVRFLDREEDNVFKTGTKYTLPKPLYRKD